MKSRTMVMLAIIHAFAAFVSGAPVTRSQLLSMAKEKVDPDVIRALVERDCVDFDVTAENAAELSQWLPPRVLEAAVRCRQEERGPSSPEPPGSASPPATASPKISDEGPVTPPPVAPRAVPPPAVGTSSIPPAAPAPAAPGKGELRVRAVFIGEPGALICTCSLDGNPIATLTKEEQSKFGEAVERAKIGRQTGYLSVSAGKHALLFRCDPHGDEVAVDVEVGAGERRTVEIAETAFRHWKLRKVEKK
jgi:hypothetical protein